VRRLFGDVGVCGIYSFMTLHIHRILGDLGPIGSPIFFIQFPLEGLRVFDIINLVYTDSVKVGRLWEPFP